MRALTPSMKSYLNRMRNGQTVMQNSITYSTYINGERMPLGVFKALANRQLLQVGKKVGSDYEIILTDLGKSIQL